MKEKNDYGMYSGGYICDQLDRHALITIHMEFPETRKMTIVTKTALIKYVRQMCSKKNVTFKIVSVSRLEDGGYFVFNKIKQNDRIIAKGTFEFVPATNHCEV